MKRSHRRVHFAIWAFSGPLILWLLVQAFADLPAQPSNEALPDILANEEAS